MDKRKRIWYQRWKLAALAQCKRTCVITGDTNRVTIHHLFNYRDFPVLRFFLSNGVALTVSLHQEFHRKYGYRNNTVEQFAEFYKLKTGKEF